MKLERVIGVVLRSGVMVSSAFIAGKAQLP